MVARAPRRSANQPSDEADIAPGRQSLTEFGRYYMRTNYFRKHRTGELLECISCFEFEPEDDRQAQINWACELYDECLFRGIEHECELLDEEFKLNNLDLIKEWKKWKNTSTMQ